MSAPLGVEEASVLGLDGVMRKLLTPEEVSRLGALPLSMAPAGDSVTVAVGPGAPANIELLLRMRLGVRRVEVRPAPRQAMERLLDAHFRPYWAEKGWEFSGLPDLPGAEAEAPALPSAGLEGAAPPGSPSDPMPAQKAGPGAGGEVRSVLLLEPPGSCRKALGDLFLAAGCEPRFAASLEEIERELGRAPPSIVVACKEGPVPIDTVNEAIGKTGGTIELRVLRGYADALLGGAGDDRLPGFLFDLMRFFTGLLSASGGEAIHRSEGRARAAEMAARQMGLSPSQVEAARLGALFATIEGHLDRMAGGATAGGDACGDRLGQLLDPARTPFPIAAAIEERAERFDGSGPRRLAGEAICPAARVLAAVDAYFAIKDAGGTGEEIESHLRAEAGAHLDPRAVEAVLRAERAERLVDRLGSTGERVLLVDPDPVAASLLQMRLSNAGLEVEVQRDGECALAAALEGRHDIVLSEIAVPGLDGFTLLLRLRRSEATRDIPFIFVTERTDRASTLRGLELGADDSIPKPADLEMLTAKVKGLIRKARSRRPSPAGVGGGVSGSLGDMGLAELLQALSACRRSVRVRVEDGRGGSGELALDKGRLVDARLGNRTGQEAFFDLTAWTRGRFTVRAEEPPADRTIEDPIEGLLLEACRLRDEAGRPA
jgi:DNA-binding response OmpR family regulator